MSFSGISHPASKRPLHLNQLPLTHTEPKNLKEISTGFTLKLCGFTKNKIKTYFMLTQTRTNVPEVKAREKPRAAHTCKQTRIHQI